MRILFLGNNRMAWQVLAHLKMMGENIVGVVVHPVEKRKYGDDILSTAGVDSECVFDGRQIGEPAVFSEIQSLRPEIGVSVLFDYILEPDFLGLFPKGVINLHPSYLPYNRGQYPNVWSIVDNTPAGVTLHFLDSGIDTGDIISRKQVPVEMVDTGESLYRKLECAGVALFKEAWPDMRCGRLRLISNKKNEGTYHATKDVDAIDAIDLDRSYTARELINMIRARTFEPYTGTYVVDKGKKIYLRMQLLYEEQLNGGGHESVYRN
jgi:methionyl-tRNA formyltransferase